MYYALILKALKMKRQCGIYATQQYLIKLGVEMHYIMLILNRDGPKKAPARPQYNRDAFLAAFDNVFEPTATDLQRSADFAMLGSL